MKINPIIPIWLMAVICIGIIVLKRKGKWPYIRQILISVLLFVINLRIMVPTGEYNVQKQEMNEYVLFVIDDTISMLAEDYDGNETRLSGVRNDCKYIMDSLPGARFAAISFNNSAVILSPFTDNTEYVASVIDAMYPVESLYARGTSLNIPQNTMINMLEDVKTKKGANAAVFFISDGEVNNGKKIDSYADVAQYVSGGAVLGYGSSKGGNMHVKSYDDSIEEIMDNSDYPPKPAVSKINEDNLKKIADDLGIKYVNCNKGCDIDDIIDNIIKNAEVKEETVSVETRGMKDTYFWLLIPLFILLGFEAVMVIKNK